MVILAGSLRDLLHFKDILAFLHCGVIVHFPLNSLNQSPLPTPFLACLLWVMKRPKWPGGRPSFPSNGIIIVHPYISLAHSGTKTFKPAEHKVAGTASKNFASGSLWVMVSGTVSTTIPWFLAVGDTVPYSRCWCKALLQSCRLLLSTWNWNCIFKRLFYLSINIVASGCWGT